MRTNYVTPLSIFVVFENVSSVVWTSSTLNPNHFVYFFPATWFLALNCFLRKELSFHQAFLTESSAVDCRDFCVEPFSNLDNFFSSNSLLVYYIYYFYHLKLRLTFFLPYTSSSNFYSVDSVFANAGWLERETAEMYGVYFLNKRDHRKLLLDYSRVESPMLKDFGTEGISDCFYNFFEEQVCVVSSEVVEL